MLPWPCGLLSEMPHRFLLMHLPLLPSSPNLPPSTTLWSTCCASPTFVSVSTGTHLCYDRGFTGEVRIQSWKSASDPHHSARTTACPHVSQTDSRTATGRVCTAPRMLRFLMWPPPKGLPASWLDPPPERWQSASSQPNHRLIYSRGTISFFHEANKTGQVLTKTSRVAGHGEQNNKGPGQVLMSESPGLYSMITLQCYKESILPEGHS